MTMRKQAHLTALGELIEVITIAALLALITDLSWAIRDSVINGFTWGMILIIMGLSTASLITAIAIYRYHWMSVKKILKENMTVQLNICKSKHKRTKNKSKYGSMNDTYY